MCWLLAVDFADELCLLEARAGVRPDVPIRPLPAFSKADVGSFDPHSHVFSEAGLDPLNEGGHRRLMVAYARAGQRSRALRQFLECRRVLVEQLGVEPAVETAGVQQRVLAGEPV